MKIQYIIGIIAIVLLLTLSGCGTTGEVVNENDVSSEEIAEEETIADESSEESNEYEGMDTKDLIKKLSEEAGLSTEDESVEEEETTEENETEEEETVESDAFEVIIESFKGNPDDFTIKVGRTVKWTNNMDNFKHAILILPKKNDSNKYETKEINDLVYLLHGESYEYTFDEAWEYKWGSKTKFDKVNGIITITE